MYSNSFYKISNNFNFSKIISIYIVVIGHYFGGVLWIPTAVSLFIFAFSSGFFTATRYRGQFKYKKYWIAKINRLLCPLIIINLFLLTLFLLQGRNGIFIWQTIPTILSLGGFFNWFHIPNPSPFGHGLWFFTLLIIFYAVYPILSIIYVDFYKATMLTISVLFSSFLGHFFLPMGHMLWLTIFGFVFGVYSSFWRQKWSELICYMPIMLVFLLSSILILNVIFHFNNFNYILLLMVCISAVETIMLYDIKFFLPNSLIHFLTGCIIYIYFIHTYLFVKNFTGICLIDFILSVTVITICGSIMHYIAIKKCSGIVFGR